MSEGLERILRFFRRDKKGIQARDGAPSPQDAISMGNLKIIVNSKSYRLERLNGRLKKPVFTAHLARLPEQGPPDNYPLCESDFSCGILLEYDAIPLETYRNGEGKLESKILPNFIDGGVFCLGLDYGSVKIHEGCRELSRQEPIKYIKICPGCSQEFMSSTY